MTDKAIALVRMWPKPPIAISVTQLLPAFFPDYQVDVFDIDRLVETRLSTSLTNSFFTLKEYGLDILSGIKSCRSSSRKTTYFFQKAKEEIANQLSKRKYAFTFQLQSLIDASLPGTPHFVYTDHTMLANLHYPSFDLRQLPHREWIRLEKTIYENATLIFTHSENISRSIIDQYQCKPEKVVCVYSGSNVPIRDDEPDQQHYIRKNILFVGKEWERKGGPELVEAFKTVLTMYSDAHLTIVGCSPHVDVANCTVIGFVPLEEVNRYYSQASIFCLPTRLEPFGSVLIEAQSHHLPVVATAIGAIPEFVVDGQNGYLVQPMDIKALAQALCDLIADPEKCQAFGERGYRLMQERYTWDKVGARLQHYIQPYLTLNGTEESTVVQDPESASSDP